MQALLIFAGLGLLGFGVWRLFAGAEPVQVPGAPGSPAPAEPYPDYGPEPLDPVLLPTSSEGGAMPPTAPETPENRAYTFTGDLSERDKWLGLIRLGATEQGNVERDATEYQRIHGMSREDALIYAMTTRYTPALDPVFVRAILAVENDPLDPRAETGIYNAEGRLVDYAVGLMQIRTDTARWAAPWRGEDRDSIRQSLKAPHLSIMLGTKILMAEFARYKRSRPDEVRSTYLWAAAAYHGGTAYYNPVSKLFSTQLETYVGRLVRQAPRFAGAFPSRPNNRIET